MKDVHLVWPHGLKFLLSSVHHEIHHGGDFPVKGAAVPKIGILLQDCSTISLIPLFHFLPMSDIDGDVARTAALSSLSSYRPSCTSNIFFSIPAPKSEPTATPPPQLQVSSDKSSKFLQLKDIKIKFNPWLNIEIFLFTYHTAFWDAPLLCLCCSLISFLLCLLP